MSGAGRTTRTSSAEGPRPRADREEAADGDLARVSPLAREHVRVLGRYHFKLHESVAGGGLRPLRDPAEPDEYEFPLPGSDGPSL